MKTRKLSINLLEGNIFQKLLLLSSPLMVTSFVNMAYNMTDTAWLGRLGTEAVAASGAAHFFVWMASAIAAISRVGTSVYVAQEYGEKNEKKLNDTIKNGMILMILITGVYTLLISIFTRDLMNLYTLEDEVRNMAIIYLRIFSFGFIINGLNVLISNIYYSLGNSLYPLIFNLVGLVINIVVDPILIFGIGFIPSMGIAGAAYASIFSQFIVLLLFSISIIKSKNEIYIAVSEGKASLSNIIQKFKKGFPAGIMSTIHSAISFQLTRYMTSYGTYPVAAYTVGSMLESITWMTTDGLQGGITAMVGQNYGAKLYDRLLEIIKKSIFIVTITGLIGTTVLMLFRTPLFRVFIPEDPNSLPYGVEYLFILGLSQLGMAIEIGSTGVFNGLGKTKTPSVISIIFNIMRIPFALILMPFVAYQGVWWAMTISSNLKGLISLLFLRKEYKKIQKRTINTI